MPDAQRLTQTGIALGILARAGLHLLAALVLTLGVAAADEHLVVVYPEIREPFRTVFRNIISGVETSIDEEVESYEIPERGRSRTAQWLEKQAPAVVITLGRRGLIEAQGAEIAVPIVAGGALLSPEDATDRVSGISLAADPWVMFRWLRQIDPTVQRVVTVYDPRRSQWIIDDAYQAAEGMGIELIARRAGDLRDAVEVYREIFDDRDLRGAALWLLQDASTVDSRTVLPLVLSESWEQNRVVFSSLLGHVPRGVLFALYPDNEAMGARLAAIARGRISNNSSNIGINPLKDLRIAINLRTADHLGLSFTREQEAQFDLTFPAR